MNSQSRIFGIGSETQIDSLVINWPSGLKDKIISPGIDQTLNVVESTPLPVVLDYFNAQSGISGITLNWQTSLEINHDHFVVERSADDYTFEEIGKRLSKSAQSDTCRYSFLDADPIPGISFYRLKQVDQDGKFIYSGWVEVSWNPDRQWDIQCLAPSTGDAIKILVLSPVRDILSLEFIDLNGKTVHKSQFEVDAGKQILDLDVQSLSSGLYVLASHFQKAGQSLVNKVLIITDQ